MLIQRLHICQTHESAFGISWNMHRFSMSNSIGKKDITSYIVLTDVKS